MPTGLQKEIVKKLRLFNKGEITGQPMHPRKNFILFQHAPLLGNHRAAV